MFYITRLREDFIRVFVQLLVNELWKMKATQCKGLIITVKGNKCSFISENISSDEGLFIEWKDLHQIEVFLEYMDTYFAAMHIFFRLCCSVGSLCCLQTYSAACLEGNSVSQR